jgi:hypothetical protein
MRVTQPFGFAQGHELVEWQMGVFRQPYYHSLVGEKGKWGSLMGRPSQRGVLSFYPVPFTGMEQRLLDGHGCGDAQGLDQ